MSNHCDPAFLFGTPQRPNSNDQKVAKEILAA
jgi:hypothetical protein